MTTVAKNIIIVVVIVIIINRNTIEVSGSQLCKKEKAKKYPSF